MLHPVFLIAAAVNDDGFVELPAAGGGAALPLGRALFGPDDSGALVQQVVPRAGAGGEWVPLDMTFFARCLGLALGPVTPDLFAVRGVAGPGGTQGRLAQTGATADEKRLRVLRGALLAHLSAYEERLV